MRHTTFWCQVCEHAKNGEKCSQVNFGILWADNFAFAVFKQFDARQNKFTFAVTSYVQLILNIIKSHLNEND